MLRIGGYINILISVAHIIGLIWADEMFAITGIGEEMAALAQTHSSLPYLLTVFVAIVFFIFGLYGLSADNKFRELPFTKPSVFLIAGIYFLRGFGELVSDKMLGTNSTSETVYSVVAIAIGFLYLVGGLLKWKSVTK